MRRALPLAAPAEVQVTVDDARAAQGRSKALAGRRSERCFEARRASADPVDLAGSLIEKRFERS
jgi:hypothetical protein